MHQRDRLSRILAIVLAGLLLAACSGAEAPPLDAEPGGAAAGGTAAEVEGTSEGEAPMLAELVATGELPPVEERLPDEPMVIEPIEQVGVYGGSWNTAILGPADNAWLYRSAGYDQLVRWDLDYEEVLPNIAESWEVSDDGTQFTFALREGIKWSDGEPFTADDILFWYEAYATDTDLLGAPPSWMMTAGEVGTVEALDDFTVRFTFTQPNGLFLRRLATPDAVAMTAMPRHYLEQFHADFNPDVQALVDQAALGDWIQLFQLRAATEDLFMTNPELPTLRAWKMTVPFGAGPRVVYERNPYYWKVDTAGNQLPYLDEIVYSVVEDPEVILFSALNGELDMHARHINDVPNKPVLAQNRESGGYHFFDIVPAAMNAMIISLNLNHQDPVKREIYQNTDFRIGLSQAINRQEIIDIVYVEQGEPFQNSPRPESPLYNEQLATQYTEYDVEAANQALDRAGYGQRDAEGFRLGPDGNRIVVTLDVALGLEDLWLNVTELLVGYWDEVGIETRVNAIDRSLFYIRKEANEHDAAVWSGPGGLGNDVYLNPRYYLPLNAYESIFAVKWAEWFNGIPTGEEPPEATRRQMELYRQLESTPDAAEQQELMAEVLQIAADEFYVIGISLPAPQYGIVANDFHNVPDSMPGAWLFPNPAPTYPEQYFISQ